MTKPIYRNVFGILAEDGEFWTNKCFLTESSAKGKLNLFQKMKPDVDYSKYQVVPITIIMKVATTTTNRKNGDG